MTRRTSILLAVLLGIMLTVLIAWTAALLIPPATRSLYLGATLGLIATCWPFYAFLGGGNALARPPALIMTDTRAGALLELPRWIPTRRFARPEIPVEPCWDGLLADVLFRSAAVTRN